MGFLSTILFLKTHSADDVAASLQFMVRLLPGAAPLPNFPSPTAFPPIHAASLRPLSPFSAPLQDSSAPGSPSPAPATTAHPAADIDRTRGLTSFLCRLRMHYINSWNSAVDRSFSAAINWWQPSPPDDDDDDDDDDDVSARAPAPAVSPVS